MKKITLTGLIYRLLIVLIIVASITSLMVAGILARYTSKVGSDDESRVALFINGEENVNVSLPAKFTPEDVNKMFDISINNNGETSVQCNLKVEYQIYGGSSIPLLFSIVDQEGNPATIILKAGEVSNDLKLNVTWDTESENNFVYSNQVGYIIITLECVQVD